MGTYTFSCKKPYKKPQELFSICAGGGFGIVEQNIEALQTLSPTSSFRVYAEKSEDGKTKEAADNLEKNGNVSVIWYSFRKEEEKEEGEREGGKNKGVEKLFFLLPAAKSSLPEWAGGLPPGIPVVPIGPGCNVKTQKMTRWVAKNIKKFKTFSAWGAGTGVTSGSQMTHNIRLPALKFGEVAYQHFRFPFDTVSSIIANPDFITKHIKKSDSMHGIDGLSTDTDDIFPNTIANWVFYSALVESEDLQDVMIAKFPVSERILLTAVAKCVEQSIEKTDGVTSEEAEASKEINGKLAEMKKMLGRVGESGWTAKKIYGHAIDLYVESVLQMPIFLYSTIMNEYLTMPEKGKMTYHVGIKIGRSRITLHHNDKFPTP